MTKTVMVPVLLGDGTGEQMVKVKYWAEFLRGPDDTCAYCHGDWDTGDIAAYFKRNPKAEACPVCDGRPT